MVRGRVTLRESKKNDRIVIEPFVDTRFLFLPIFPQIQRLTNKYSNKIPQKFNHLLKNHKPINLLIHALFLVSGALLIIVLLVINYNK